MQSKNFEYLRSAWEDLATLGAFAEQYAVVDPQSAVSKLRTFAEQIANFIYLHHGLPKSSQPNLNDLLTSTAFAQAVPRVVVTKLHSLRIQGNRGVHGESVLPQSAVMLLQEAHELGRWMYLTYSNGNLQDCPIFVAPQVAADSAAETKLKREKVQILQRLVAQEAEMQKLIVDLEAARSKARVAEESAAQLQNAQELGQQMANVLSFDEATTRRHLIDSMLVSAGWRVGGDGKSTEEVGQEILVQYQPTNSKEGFADYVLYRKQDGKALGVIEAKKTAIDPERGREQARLYADGIAKEQGGLRPIIFCTNGYETTIWNDAQNEPPRKVYGFYSKDSLEYLLVQNEQRKPATQITVNTEITKRIYQIEAIKRVTERFAAGHRNALVVQATGTGKTRVAILLCDALISAGWARRILFLCDRRELRKQAKENFQRYLNEPLVYVTANTYKEREHRIYLATYPAMMKVFESFDVGFFDLVICDESHRSIYNRYRDLLLYFDAYQVGLTATPVKFISRNTYSFFGCEDKDPTSHYSYSEALSDSAGPFLVPFKVKTISTDFTRKGIKYSELSPEQKQQIEEDEVDAKSIEFESHDLDKKVFNLDTIRIVLENLMQNGIREASSSHVGKSIIFARNHDHAILLQKQFFKLYPQYGGNFCKVIDNYEPRAEQLIEDFKKKDSEPVIAISVDMMDTGIDVPEVVNLVFAKPVYS